ncbi:Delta-like protein 4 [Portunus trituberculatus]|uniref:Delta-like protein 4 n=1 Tax=Portunus trituberculatus TaxID=210409 RepID=A0A5B7CQ07_PORTR|nr:Delta-like protein 4 [Portunus trituberculatus]
MGGKNTATPSPPHHHVTTSPRGSDKNSAPPLATDSLSWWVEARLEVPARVRAGVEKYVNVCRPEVVGVYGRQRVCLSHAPRSGPVEVGRPKSRTGIMGACPLGLLVTRVVANGSLVARDQGVLDMTFPFTQQWPEDFKLILEAWHDVTGQLFRAPRPGKEKASPTGGQLIARHVAHHHQEGGRPWSFHAHANAHTGLRYALKVTCTAPHHGPDCSEVGDGMGWVRLG